MGEAPLGPKHDWDLSFKGNNYVKRSRRNYIYSRPSRRLFNTHIEHITKQNEYHRSRSMTLFLHPQNVQARIHVHEQTQHRSNSNKCLQNIPMRLGPTLREQETSQNSRVVGDGSHCEGHTKSVKINYHCYFHYYSNLQLTSKLRVHTLELKSGFQR